MSDKVIIDRQVLEDITDWEKDWGQPFGEFLEDFTTPLVLCGECDHCTPIKDVLSGITRLLFCDKHSRLTTKDDYCKDGVKA